MLLNHGMHAVAYLKKSLRSLREDFAGTDPAAVNKKLQISVEKKNAFGNM
jgi:hypothetical protein